MPRIILITGGSRSGKSAFALKVAEALPGPRAFVATCPVTDEEMRERIRRHQEQRSTRDWHTVEEPLDLCGVVRESPGFRVFLVDCLTLWINNLLFRSDEEHLTVTEDDIEEKCRELLAACTRTQASVIFVTNEVGSGVVPENRLARLFRDLTGRCNQIMAEEADEVHLVACGIPITLKKGHS